MICVIFLKQTSIDSLVHGDQSNVIYLQSSNSTSLLVGKEFSRENQFTAAMFFVMVIDSVCGKRETNVIKQPIFYHFFLVKWLYILELVILMVYAHAHKW